MELKIETNSVWNTILSQKWGKCGMTAIITFGKTLRRRRNSLKQGTGKQATAAARPEAMRVVRWVSQPCKKQQEVLPGLLCIR